MVFLQLCSVLLPCISALSKPAELTDRPVIGVLSLPIEDDFPHTNATSYVAASYVNWVSMSGARVVPLRLDSSWEELEMLVKQLNGVLFTGGSAEFWNFDGNNWPPLSNYSKTGCFLYELVKEINDQGTYLPLWGTCLGFELLHLCAYPEYGVLPSFNGDPAYVQRNNFTSAGKDSRMFAAKGGKQVQSLMSTHFIHLLSHNHGIQPKEYHQWKNLSDVFRPLATTRDKDQEELVSMIEGINYPIYGTQFHLEKNLYEWDPAIPVPHNQQATAISTYLSEFFISEARRNSNSFASEAALKPYLIYNWSPYFFDDHLYQLYFLN